MITRLNHAVLYVADLDRAHDFYAGVLGLELVADEGFMRFYHAPDSDNHHDLGLMALGAGATRPPPQSTGLYHLAWEVASIHDLAAMAQRLSDCGALNGASDHGVSKSVYGADPDGNELEVMWRVPAAAWGEYAERGVVLPLDLDAEIARWG
ncbi:MAG: VOC family protein [Acidimicrobiia bacterium]